jgi:two-component system, response regulator
MGIKPFHVLLVEDNAGHAELVKRTLKDEDRRMVVHHVDDGEAALDYLYRRDRFKNPVDCPRPHLVLLDLRMPKVDGLEVLSRIKSDKDLCIIPVVVLTTSDSETDIMAAYRNRTNSYLVKPFDFNEFTQLMEETKVFWMQWNHLPELA